MDDVREVQERFDQAELTGDRDTLGDLIVDDFQSIGPRGFVLTKEQWIGRHGEFVYNELATSDMSVHDYGETAIVRNIQRNRATYQGRDVAVNTRVSQVWVVQGDRWRLAAIQFSPLADG
jgi:ketosteroid isomerase-like protein